MKIHASSAWCCNIQLQFAEYHRTLHHLSFSLGWAVYIRINVCGCMFVHRYMSVWIYYIAPPPSTPTLHSKDLCWLASESFLVWTETDSLHNNNSLQTYSDSEMSSWVVLLMLLLTSFFHTCLFVRNCILKTLWNPFCKLLKMWTNVSILQWHVDKDWERMNVHSQGCPSMPPHRWDQILTQLTPEITPPPINSLHL